MGVEHGWRPSSPVAVALVDVFANGRSGRSDLAMLRANTHVQRTVAYGWARGDAATQAALSMGAQGYISKNARREEFTSLLQLILTGERTSNQAPPPNPGDSAAGRHPAVASLTPREAEVMSMIGEGYSNIEIAQECFLSINSVKSYIRAAYRKIGVDTRPQAIRWALGQDRSGPARQWPAGTAPAAPMSCAR